MSIERRRVLFRDRQQEERAPVTTIELFFDLVFVFAITQLSHRLLEHFTLLGALETLVLFLGIWWVWINTSWATNWLDPERPLVRVMLMVMMLLGLLQSSAIADAFGRDGPMFAGTLAAMQIGRTAFVVWAVRGVEARNHDNFRRMLAWSAVSAGFWIAGGLSGPGYRLLLWALALVIENIGPAVRFYVPGLGRSAAGDWNISGGHVAERCALFVIIALGETLLVTGTSYAGLVKTPATTAAFAITFLGSATMWWLYFATGAKRGEAHIEGAAKPGLVARNAYTYLHIPIVAGITVTAVGDAMVLTAPLDRAGWGFAAVTLGGPALYVAGTMAFKRATSRMDWFPLSHRVGLGLLALAAPFAPALRPLALVALATGVLLVIAIWEAVSLRRNPDLAEAESAA